MTEFRIVCNEKTGLYRIEGRRWWSWSFIMDASGEDYLTYENYQDAQCFVCRQLRRKRRAHRRWKVVDFCDRLCPSC